MFSVQIAKKFLPPRQGILGATCYKAMFTGVSCAFWMLHGVLRKVLRTVNCREGSQRSQNAGSGGNVKGRRGAVSLAILPNLRFLFFEFRLQ